MSRSLQGVGGGIAYVEYLEGEADGVVLQPLIKTSRLKYLQSKEVAIDNLFSVIKQSVDTQIKVEHKLLHNQWSVFTADNHSMTSENHRRMFGA